MTSAMDGALLTAPRPEALVEPRPVDLSSLTHLQALDALVGGQPVVSGKAEPVVLPDAARKVLAFYAAPSERSLWDAPKRPNVTDGEIRRLLDALDGDVPKAAEVARPDGAQRPRWRLIAASICQFGGLHAHCGPTGAAPPALPLAIDADILLLIGPNGAGKSQITKALAWGLTGQVPRSHDEPARFETLVNRYTPRAAAADATGFELPTIVPFPGQSHMRALNQQPLVATAVELTFERDGGERLVLRRDLRRTGKEFGSVVSIIGEEEVETPSVADALGVSELALAASVLTMARLPFIRLDGPNALTRGIAELTGIAPLKQLGERLRDPVRRWLKDDYPKKQRAEIKKREPRFREATASLTSALANLRPPLAESVPPTPQEKDGGAASVKALETLETTLAEREADARRVVNETTGIDLTTANLDDLLAQVRHAKAQCATDSVDRLLNRALESWQAITAADAEAALLLMRSVEQDAHAFARIDAERETAARLRLYAGLRVWATANSDAEWPTENCPVCETPLADKMDKALSIAIRDAMTEIERQEIASHVDADAWNRSACAHLEQNLPVSVRHAVERSSAESAVALRQTLTDGLIQAARLTGPLAGLAGRLRMAVAAIQVGFPAPAIPASFDLPERVTNGACAKRLALIATTLAQAEWLRRAEPSIRALRRAVEETADNDEDVFNLFQALTEVERVLESHRPLKTARDATDAFRGLLKEWEGFRDQILRAAAAVAAIAPAETLIELVDRQVDTLMSDLHERTDTLCRRVYDRTNTAGPDLHRVDVVEGALKRQAAFDDMVGDGGEVLNASRDRAWLFAFAIALLERIRDRDGGLSFLLLDDPQALFDESNQRTLAKGLGSLPADGTRLALVTFDHHFAAALGRLAPPKTVANFQIGPRSSQGLRATIRPLDTELERARRAWKHDDQAESQVRWYCSEARHFLERALCDLMWSSRVAIDGGETLQPLFDKLAMLAKRGPPYNKNCFRQLIEHRAWKDEKVKEAINWSHHHSRTDLKPPHAEHLEPHLDEIVGMIEACQKALDQVLTAGRVPVVETVVNLPAQTFTRRSFVNQGVLAARNHASADDASAPEPGDPVVLDPDRHALFVVGSGMTWLKPLCNPGDLLVVNREAEAKPGLSVALVDGTAFAGWLRQSSNSGFMLLEGNPDHDFLKEIDPRRHAIHPIAGIFFKAAAAGGGIMSPCGEMPILSKVAATVPVVTGQSAEPLLRVGERVFIGQPLDGWPSSGVPVVVRLLKGEHLLKRVGQRLDRTGQALVLDSLGWQGNSVAARLPGPVAEGFDTLPIVESINTVLGVWFGGTGR